MLVGYVRVSTDDQTTELQKDALLKFGCKPTKGFFFPCALKFA